METGPRLVSLELGGKNAMVVRDDADLDLAVDGAVFGAFGTAGQRCTSTSRLIVHPDVADELVDRIVKRAGELRARRPARPGTDVGPVITRLVGRAHRRHGRRRGRRGRHGRLPAARSSTSTGCEGGAFVAPTVLTGVRARAPHRPRGGVRAGARGARGGRPRRGRRRRQQRRVRPVGRRLHPRHRHRPAAGRRHRHRHRLRERPDDRRRDPAAVRRHQAHRQRLPRGRHPGHRAVQPGQDRLRRLLGPPAEGADRQPHPLDDRRRPDDASPTPHATADWLARALRRRGGRRAAQLLRRGRRARARGRWIIDVDGRRYLDLGSGIAVTNVGHCHPDGRRGHRRAGPRR